MRKIKVPEGMLQAASCPCGVVDYEGLKRTLEAALLWLTKNPSQPDEDQMDGLCRKYTWLDKDSVRFGAREWQRRMFLAPEPAVQSFDTPYGRFEIDERVPPGEIRLYDWSGPVLVKNLRTPEHIAEHERGEQPIPLSAIQNLLWGDWHREHGFPEEVNGIFVIETHNAQLEEAFRRGVHARGRQSAEVKPSPTTIEQQQPHDDQQDQQPQAASHVVTPAWPKPVSAEADDQKDED